MAFPKQVGLAAVTVLAGMAAVYGWNLSNGDSLPEGIVSGNGRVEAVQVDVSTKYAGRVASVMVREGDLVEPDQVIAEIDISHLEAQRHRAQAEVASSESLVAAAKAQVTMSKAQLLLAEQELDRTANLFDRGHSSQETYDIRLTERDVAVSSVASATASLTAAERRVDAARATVDEIETQIDDGVLTSPVFGRVLYRLAQPGEVVPAGGKVVTIVNHDDIFMEIFLPSSQAHLVNVGSEARIRLDIFEFGIPAAVSFVSPEAQFTPKQVETSTERDKLMFRVKIRVTPDLIRHNIERVKTGLRGVAYVQLDGAPEPDWSALLPPMPSEALPEARGADDS